MTKKQQYLDALLAFINQRSGIEWGNYSCGDYKRSREAFNGDYRPILKRGKQARAMLAAIRWRDSITVEKLIEATRAYSGRLQFKEQDGKVWVEYCTGQYFPTEYRSAACAVLSKALWDYWCENKPEGELKHNSETGETLQRYRGLRLGDYIAKQARNELGRSIAKDWFN